jgi:hypothetical protein
LNGVYGQIVIQEIHSTLFIVFAIIRVTEFLSPGQKDVNQIGKYEICSRGKYQTGPIHEPINPGSRLKGDDDKERENGREKCGHGFSAHF